MEFALLATLIERTVEMFAAPLFAQFGWNKLYQMYVALALGLLLAFGAQLDAAALVFPHLTLPMPIAYAITGILIGGGASLLHEFLPTGTIGAALKQTFR